MSSAWLGRGFPQLWQTFLKMPVVPVETPAPILTICRINERCLLLVRSPARGRQRFSNDADSVPCDRQFDEATLHHLCTVLVRTGHGVLPGRNRSGCSIAGVEPGSRTTSWSPRGLCQRDFTAPELAAPSSSSDSRHTIAISPGLPGTATRHVRSAAKFSATGSTSRCLGRGHARHKPNGFLHHVSSPAPEANSVRTHSPAGHTSPFGESVSVPRNAIRSTERGRGSRFLRRHGDHTKSASHCE
jgi:hypothetical protein